MYILQIPKQNCLDSKINHKTLVAGLFTKELLLIIVETADFHLTSSWSFRLGWVTESLEKSHSIGKYYHGYSYSTQRQLYSAWHTPITLPSITNDAQDFDCLCWHNIKERFWQVWLSPCKLAKRVLWLSALQH